MILKFTDNKENKNWKSSFIISDSISNKKRKSVQLVCIPSGSLLFTYSEMLKEKKPLLLNYNQL